MIRTLVEVRNGRISILETPEETQVTITLDGEESTLLAPAERLYTSEEVGHYQATEAELVAAPLRREVASLERHRENLVTELDAALIRIGELDHKVRLYDQDRKTERDRADQNRAWAERAELRAEKAEITLTESRELVAFKTRVADEIDQEADRLRDKVRELAQGKDARDRLLHDATSDRDRMAAQIGKVNGAVHSPAILAALRTTWSMPEAKAMQTAIRDVRQAIGSPGPGTSPE